MQDEERRKLSRDLHDSTGQTLAALKMAVACLQEDCKQYPSAMLLASEVAGMADVAIEEIRTMSYLLHPPLLNEVGFACAAEWYVELFAKRVCGGMILMSSLVGWQGTPFAAHYAATKAYVQSLAEAMH